MGGVSTIDRFLYGSEYQPPINTEEIYYKMKEIRKIIWSSMGSEKKVVIVKLIVEWIASNRQNDVWVLGFLGVTSQKIK